MERKNDADQALKRSKNPIRIELSFNFHWKKSSFAFARATPDLGLRVRTGFMILESLKVAKPWPIATRSGVGLLFR